METFVGFVADSCGLLTLLLDFGRFPLRFDQASWSLLWFSRIRDSVWSQEKAARHKNLLFEFLRLALCYSSNIHRALWHGFNRRRFIICDWSWSRLTWFFNPSWSLEAAILKIAKVLLILPALAEVGVMSLCFHFHRLQATSYHITCFWNLNFAIGC